MGVLFLIVLAVAIFIYFKMNKDKARAQESRDNFSWYLQKEKDLLENHGFSKENMTIYSSVKRTGPSDKVIIVDKAVNKLAFIESGIKSFKVTTGDKVISAEINEEKASLHKEKQTSFGSHSATTDTYIKSISMLVVTEDIGSMELFFHYDHATGVGLHGGHYLTEHRAEAIRLRSTLQKMSERAKPVSSGSGSVADQILRLDSLLKEGVINEEEFNKAKDKLLA